MGDHLYADCATLVICHIDPIDASYYDLRWELTCGSVDTGVGAAVEAAEAEVGAVGVALAGAPAVAHRACALGVRQRAGRRALPAAASAVAAAAAVAAEGPLCQAVVLLAHRAVHVVPGERETCCLLETCQLNVVVCTGEFSVSIDLVKRGKNEARRRRRTSAQRGTWIGTDRAVKQETYLSHCFCD